jgi:methyl-accepting chemotaxis protein
MLKNLGLRTKLLGGFLIVAAITLVVGGLAFFQLSSLAEKSARISTVDLPGVQESLAIKAEIYSVGQSLRTLMSPEIGKEDRLRQFENIGKARERSAKAMESYEKLDVDDKAKSLYEDFKAKFLATRESNNKAVELARKVIESDILKPDLLQADLQQFRGDHYKLATNWPP